MFGNDLNYLPVKNKMMQINFLNRLIKLPCQLHFKEIKIKMDNSY